VQTKEPLCVTKLITKTGSRLILTWKIVRPAAGHIPIREAAARARDKLEAQQQERDRRWEADKLEIAVASRNEGRTEAEAAAQHRFTILLNENAQLKEDMQTTVDERVNKLVADREAKFDVERALHAQEVTKLKAQVAKFGRIGDQRSSNRLGEMTEMDIFNGLKNARPEDNIRRVPKGKEGADITQRFMENRKEIGKVIWEAKNTSRWQEPYADKLYADQVRENADWAVCVLGPAAFPQDRRPQPMAYKDILLCLHEDVVPFMEILRRATISLHRARAAGNDAGAAKAKMFALFASGEGHTLLHSVTNTIPQLKRVNKDLVEDVDKRIRASNKLLDGQQQNLGRVFTAIDGIISGNDDDAQ
jgi:hypothetical protein